MANSVWRRTVLGFLIAPTSPGLLAVILAAPFRAGTAVFDPGVQALTGFPVATSVQNSTTYETTGAVTAALAQDARIASQVVPAAPIQGVGNQFILGPHGSAATASPK
jgi:hypothetical protein